MFCQKCGKAIPDNSVFCSFCGYEQGRFSSAPKAANGAERIRSLQRQFLDGETEIKQPEVKEEPKEQEKNAEKTGISPVYTVMSWIFFVLTILLGINAFKNSHTDVQVYHAIIIFLSSLVFIPKITIKSLKDSPVFLLIAKVAVCGILILIL